AHLGPGVLDLPERVPPAEHRPSIAGAHGKSHWFRLLGSSNPAGPGPQSRACRGCGRVAFARATTTGRIRGVMGQDCRYFWPTCWCAGALKAYPAGVDAYAFRRSIGSAAATGRAQAAPDVANETDPQGTVRSVRWLDPLACLPKAGTFRGTRRGTGVGGAALRVTTASGEVRLDGPEPAESP